MRLYHYLTNNESAYSLVTAAQIATVLADRIKELRLMRKWKQSTLAERAGVSLASLQGSLLSTFTPPG